MKTSPFEFNLAKALFLLCLTFGGKVSKHKRRTAAVKRSPVKAFTMGWPHFWRIFLFKRDLARALLRIWFVVLVLVSPSVKICIISCHIHNFVSAFAIRNSQRIPKEFQKNSQIRTLQPYKKIPKKFPKNSQKIPKKFLKKFFKRFQKDSKKITKKFWLVLIGRNPFRACWGFKILFNEKTWYTWFSRIFLTSLKRSCWFIWKLKIRETLK